VLFSQLDEYHLHSLLQQKRQQEVAEVEDDDEVAEVEVDQYLLTSVLDEISPRVITMANVLQRVLVAISSVYSLGRLISQPSS
jgi:hypothetical protein